MTKALQRPQHGTMIAGVCAGIAQRAGWNVGLVRLLFVLSCVLPGPQILVYIGLWILMPKQR